MPTDSSLVIYTGVSTPYIPMVPNQTLQTILQNIDTALNRTSIAPVYSSFNYGPYDGYTVTTTTGGVPSNAQQFAEGISKIVCIDQYNLAHFTGTTYVSDQAVITAAISALQTPALTYSYSGGGGSISITSGMTRNQVLTATYTGVGNILALLNSPGTSWASLSITAPTNISTAFNDLITYLVSLTSTVSGKQTTIATIDNSANVLTSSGGTSTDTVRTTAVLLTTYVTTLPTLNLSGFTWGGVTTGTTLTNSLQYTVNAVNTLYTNAVVANGTGLTIASVGTTYQGKKLAIDTTYTTLYKAMVDSADTTPDFLAAKLVAGTGIALTVQNVAGDENILVTNTVTATNEVSVNASDNAPNYLQNKIPATYDTTWGLSLNSTSNQNNSQLILTPSIGNASLFNQAFLNFISTDPYSITLWQNFISQLTGASAGPGISNLSVALSGGNFVLTWTAQSGTSQQAKWRVIGNSQWANIDFTPANPLSNSAVTTTLSTPPIVSNQPYQMQVDTIYPGGTVGSNIYEMIKYLCQTITHTVVAGVISVNQTPLFYISSLTYQLVNGSSVVLQTITTTGSSPAVSFTSVASGTYSVRWVYGTMINGAMLYSSDASQLTTYCSATGITV